MLSKTEGVILKSIKYGETSLIQDIYTKEYGLKSYIVSGVRNKKKSKAGSLQLMSIVELVAYHKKNNNSLSRIKEIKPLIYYKELPFEVLKSSVGIFITEVARRSISQDEQNEELYAFLKESYLYLDKATGSFSLFPILFLIKFSQLTGFGPSTNYSEVNNSFHLMEGTFGQHNETSNYSLDPEISQYLYSLLFENYGISDLFTVPKATRQQLLQELVNFYRIHVDGFGKLNSLTVLRELFD